MKMISIQEVAALIGCSVVNVRLLSKGDGCIPCYKPISRKKVMIRSEIFEIPERVQGKTKPKYIYLQNEVDNWLQNKYDKK
jgi:hypothetical protein